MYILLVLYFRANFRLGLCSIQNLIENASWIPKFWIKVANSSVEMQCKETEYKFEWISDKDNEWNLKKFI